MLDTRTRQWVELLDLTTQWLADYPDLALAAEAEARQLLERYQLPALDVHRVYWHRFDTAVSSPVTFNGWAHSGPPIRSLTLPQLIMQRFPAADQDSLDQLDVMSGFYTLGAGDQRYDERHEVRLLPSQASAHFWQQGFAERYRAHLENFWRARAQDFVALSRAGVLAALGDARSKGLLGREALRTLGHAFAPGIGTDLSVQVLARHRPPAPGVKVAGISIAGVGARDLLHVQGPEGAHYLYLPNTLQGFKTFANESAMARWLAQEAATSQGLARLRAHFAPTDTQASAALARLAKGSLPQPWLSLVPLPPGSDPFAWLGERAAAEMRLHADHALTSNNQLRKDAAIAFLSTLAHLAADFAPIGWPVALGAVTSAAIAMGLDIDKAVHSRSGEERNAAIIAAIGQGLTAVFSVPFLFAGEVADWPWEVDEEPDVASLEPPPVPHSPVSAWPLNSRGMIEQTDLEMVFAVEDTGRDLAPGDILRNGLAPTTRFARVAPMVEGPALRVFGSAEGALAYAGESFDGPFHLFRVQAKGLKVASLRLNLRFNRANTLALLGQTDRALSATELPGLAEGAWLEHEAHLAMAGMSPARLRLLSPVSRRPWEPLAVNVLRGVRRQVLSDPRQPGYLIDVSDGLRQVRFDPISGSWKTLGGSAFRYNEPTGLFEPVQAGDAREALAPEIEAATAELGMPATYPWTLAPVSAEGAVPLPRQIHSIWLGRRLPRKLAQNLLLNARRAGAGQAPFEYHLYLDIHDPLDHSLTLADLAQAPGNLKIHALQETAFFQDFQQTPYFLHYLAATEGTGINYASAADVLRYRLLHAYGGVYMDLDDLIYDTTLGNDGFADQDWTVRPGHLLLNNLVSEPRLGLHCGFNTSNFATLPDNPTLAAVSEESYRRFLANRDLYHERPYEGADDAQAVTRYARRISRVTGPGVFNEVLMEHLADLRQFRAIARIATELHVPPGHLAALHRELRRHTRDYCPLAWRIRIGSTASWLHTR